MKLLTRSLSLLTIASLVLFFASCGGDGNDGPSKEENAFNQLDNVWTLSSVTLNDADRESDFDNFVLTLSGDFDSENPNGPYEYSVAGSMPDPSPWPQIGEWIFDSINTDSGLIVRDPETENEIGMSYKILSNGDLELTLVVPEGSGWRVAEVEGTWVFTFTN